MGMEGGASVSVGGGGSHRRRRWKRREGKTTEQRTEGDFFPIRDLLMLLTRRPRLPGPSLEVVFF